VFGFSLPLQLQDDESQAKKATKLIIGAESVLITDVVLTETI
jgi:hypothetical protein